ncbi:hypothetical protein [Pedobacter rhodius]|uniref:CarboxypepD_reg-like domain-containing protein n=1 Tax=Pedobacter rhodius TaxID=3004098 RepID=A0ABT4KZS2_9SPHI|nr:hypothetical protein [Pedobacter sp. SJ11]MCZ4224435.1 hypothetical protein [Pedobacter sp. SJ11]
MRIFFILTLILISGKISAQQINGQVLDYTSKLPVDNVVIIYGTQTIITTGSGKFSFQKKSSPDIIKVKKLGYQDYDLNLSNNFKDITIYLKQSSINLNDVLILPKRDYLADSLKLRKDYATIFAYKAPGVKDMLVEKGWRYPTFGSNLVSNSTSSIISLDVLKTIGLLTKNKSSISKLQKVQLKDEESNYINHRFDVEKIASITKLEGDSLQSFIQKYRPSATEIRKMNDYQLLMYVKKSYTEFIKPNKD